ncbi:hypothetical protein VE00_11115 [Pseudogymnoascus sp. WSF 3629]|nr:hypothetical protein VE00_11115 [Pseudogymnoascus sp. WSF 3629]
MKNQTAYEGCGDMIASAMIFYREAMGESMPPTVEARAIPRISALDMLESEGRLQSIGWMMEKHRTSVVTLEIYMLAKAATNIFVTSTARRRVPALERKMVAIRLAISYFDNAAAMVKPPRRSIITSVHIAAKMYAVASFVLRRWCRASSKRTTRRRTHRKGMRRDVTNKGMTYAFFGCFSVSAQE